MLFLYFQETPLWIIFTLTCLIVLIAYGIGLLLGKHHRQVLEEEDRSPVGSIVAASLGLLAFLLAFSFGIAASKFDERRNLVLEEANAIGTTYLRAGYLEEPYKTDIRKLLKEYLSVRLEAVNSGQLNYGLKKSDELQDKMWSQAESVAKKLPDSIVVGLFIQTLNDVIDLHAKRIHVGLHIRMPLIIWGALYFVLLLAIGSLGYQFGVTHTHFFEVNILLILTFSSVITLIADLDRPQEGFITVSQQALVDLLNRIK